MKITIEPETEEEKKQLEKQIFENVFEYSLIGMKMEGVIPHSICTWSGDKFVLIGRAHELIERIKNHGDKRNTK